MPRRNKTGHATGRPTKRMQLATRAQILKMYTEGRTVEEMALALNLLPATIENHLNAALDAMVAHWSKPSPEHTFIRYASFQLGIITKLKEAYDSFMKDADNKQYNSAVSALKAQSDIMDKVVTKGHEMGVITSRRADRSLSMSKADLRQELKNEIELLSSLLAQVDGHDTFKRRRAAVQRGQPKRRYIARIRKVKRNALGFVTALPDWKYKKTAHEQAGGIIPQVNPAPSIQVTEETTEIELNLEEIDRLDQEIDRSKQGDTTSAGRKNIIEARAEVVSRPTAGYEQPTDYSLT